MSFDIFGVNPDMEFKEKYQTIIAGLGLDNVINCVPFSISEIKNAIKEDEHLNNLPLGYWDTAAGFKVRGKNVYSQPSALRSLLKSHGINSYSCSEGVCILKEAARMSLERNKTA